MILTFRPIKVWPEGWKDPGRRRESCPFQAGYSDTLEILDREVHHLGARDVTLQVDATERDCRLDGQLRADAKVGHPGVILTIDTKRHGALVYSTDRFNGAPWRSIPSWQANFRAIALGLEALRKVERYGIADRGQQYTGYRELPSGLAMPSAMSVEDAVRLLAGFNHDYAFEDLMLELDEPNSKRTWLKDAHRFAAKQTHPDAGGDPDLFRRVQEAWDVVEAHGRAS